MTASPLVVRLSAAAPHSDGSADFPSRGKAGFAAVRFRCRLEVAAGAGSPEMNGALKMSSVKKRILFAFTAVALITVLSSLCAAFAVNSGENYYYDTSVSARADVSEGKTYYCSKQDDGDGRYIAACLESFGVNGTAYFGVRNGALVLCDESEAAIAVHKNGEVYEISSAVESGRTVTAEDLKMPSVTVLIRSQTDTDGVLCNYYDNADVTLTLTYTASEAAINSGSASNGASPDGTDRSGSDTLPDGQIASSSPAGSKKSDMPLPIKIAVAAVIAVVISAAIIIRMVKSKNKSRH